MFQTLRQKKALNRCVINRDVKHTVRHELSKTDCFFIGGALFSFLTLLVRINFNV